MLKRTLKYFAIGSTIGLTVFAASKKDKIFADSRKPIDIEFQEKYGGGRVKDVKEEISKYGYPLRSADVSSYTNHVLCYNTEKRIPNWVLEVLVNRNTTGEGATRNKAGGFKVDPSQHPKFASHNDDYNKSGWSRGHMAAAGNHKFHQPAMNDTFFLSNIVPQDIDNNSGFWNQIEIYTRDLLSKYQRIWVLTGPLFLPVKEADKLMVKYEVIGDSQVAVPTHLFKVLVAEGDQKNFVGAFVVPNQPIAKNKSLVDYQVPLEFVESHTGLLVFPRLDRSRAEDLCRQEGCQLKPLKDFKRMQRSNSTG